MSLTVFHTFYTFHVSSNAKINNKAGIFASFDIKYNNNNSHGSLYVPKHK